MRPVSFNSVRHLPGIVGVLLILAAAGCGTSGRSEPTGDTVGAARKEPVDNGLLSESERDPKTAARFVDATERSGVRFTYRNGQEAGHFSILESLGGGVALLDYDGDGWLDLFLPGGGEFAGREIRGLAPALFRNRGGWTFADVAAQAGVALAPYYSHGAAVADYDNDGFPDVLVTGYGGLVLFRNQGDGTFVEQARAAGLDDRLWSSSAAWGDVDRDGNLDLYVAHYANWSFENHPFCPGPGPGQREVCPPRRFDPLPDTFYASNGDGTFRDATEERGLRQSDPNDHGKGLGVVMADVDLDGDVDLYVANDTVPNFLYRNDGTGRFQDASMMSGTSLSDAGTPDGSMGVDLGDFNLDGLPDLWVANFERESFALYRNEGNGNFYHVSQATGVTAVGGLYVGWGTVFFDFDRDGDEDIFVSNGHVVRFPTNAPLRQKPLLFENRSAPPLSKGGSVGGRRFVNVAPQAGEYLDSPHMGRGVAVGDIDDDGDLDLAVSHTNEPLAVLSNVGESFRESRRASRSESSTESAAGNHWISLRLIGTRSNRDAVGALVRLRTPAGEQTRQIKGGTSYASSNDLRVFFGLGTETTIERITIRWPSGTVQDLTDEIEGRPVDRVLTVHEPADRS